MDKIDVTVIPLESLSQLPKHGLSELPINGDLPRVGVCYTYTERVLGWRRAWLDTATTPGLPPAGEMQTASAE